MDVVLNQLFKCSNILLFYQPKLLMQHVNVFKIMMIVEINEFGGFFIH